MPYVGIISRSFSWQKCFVGAVALCSGLATMGLLSPNGLKETNQKTKRWRRSWLAELFSTIATQFGQFCEFPLATWLLSSTLGRRGVIPRQPFWGGRLQPCWGGSWCRGRERQQTGEGALAAPVLPSSLPPSLLPPRTHILGSPGPNSSPEPTAPH